MRTHPMPWLAVSLLATALRGRPQLDDHLGIEDAVTHVWHTPCWNDFPATALLSGIMEISSDLQSSYAAFGDGVSPVR